MTELDITGISSEMAGVGRLDGMAVFVPGALPGERVRIDRLQRQRSFARAEIGEIISVSPERAEPQCPHYNKCGGCALQHAEYDATLRYKSQVIIDALRRIGHLDDAEALFKGMRGMERPFNYRNRVQFPVGGTADKPKVGFFRGETHDVIDLPDGCMLADRRLNKALTAFKGWLRGSGLTPYDRRSGRGLIRHVVFRVAQRGALMAVVVINGDRLPNAEPLWNRFKQAGCTSLYININKSRRSDDAEVFSRSFIRLYGDANYIDNIGQAAFELSAPSFFQINPDITLSLYQKAAELIAIRPYETLLDAYCGVGTLGIFTTSQSNTPDVRLYGVEVIDQAVENARRNAELNGIKDSRYLCGACEDVIARLVNKGMCPDAAFVDPPRRGCDARLIEALCQAGRQSLKRIVYVSCDPATLARDIARFMQDGWRVECAYGFDMFPWTRHVETVCLLTNI